MDRKTENQLRQEIANERIRQLEAQSVPVAKTADDVFEILGEIAESGGVGRLPKQSVAVVGEPIYWIDPDDDANLSRISRVGWSPLYGESPASIPAADLARLRENAAMADELRKDAEIAITSIYIALDALNEIIEMDGQDNLGDAKREATKAMAQLAAIAQSKGE